MSEEETHVAPITYPEFRQGARDLAERRHKAVEELIEQINLAAIAEGNYQRTKAGAFVRLKKDCTATEAEARVKGEDDVAEAGQDRDIQRDLVKAGYARLDTIDAERATLHRLAEWSQRIDPNG